jgi:hypothetical protein
MRPCWTLQLRVSEAYGMTRTRAHLRRQRVPWMETGCRRARPVSLLVELPLREVARRAHRRQRSLAPDLDRMGSGWRLGPAVGRRLPGRLARSRREAAQNRQGSGRCESATPMRRAKGVAAPRLRLVASQPAVWVGRSFRVMATGVAPSAEEPASIRELRWPALPLQRLRCRWRSRLRAIRPALRPPEHRSEVPASGSAFGSETTALPTACQPPVWPEPVAETIVHEGPRRRFTHCTPLSALSRPQSRRFRAYPWGGGQDGTWPQISLP